MGVSEEVGLPIYLELHRGSVTQKIPTVLAMIEQAPGIRFNADFSHYITAYRWLESFDEKNLQQIDPILSRIGYLHLRVADSRHIQLAHPDSVALELYQLLLKATLLSF